MFDGFVKFKEIACYLVEQIGFVRYIAGATGRFGCLKRDKIEMKFSTETLCECFHEFAEPAR